MREQPQSPHPDFARSSNGRQNGEAFCRINRKMQGGGVSRSRDQRATRFTAKPTLPGKNRADLTEKGYQRLVLAEEEVTRIFAEGGADHH